MDTLIRHVIGRQTHRPDAKFMKDEQFIMPAGMPAFSEQHLRFLAESLPEIVWTALPDGTVDFMNRRWFTYTGQRRPNPKSEKNTP